MCLYFAYYCKYNFSDVITKGRLYSDQHLVRIVAYSDQHLVQIVCYSDQHLVRIQTSGGWLYSDQHCTFVGTFVGIHQRDGGTFDLFVGMEAEYGLHMGTARIICGACTLTY